MTVPQDNETDCMVLFPLYSLLIFEDGWAAWQSNGWTYFIRERILKLIYVIEIAAGCMDGSFSRANYPHQYHRCYMPLTFQNFFHPSLCRCLALLSPSYSITPPFFPTPLISAVPLFPLPTLPLPPPPLCSSPPFSLLPLLLGRSPDCLTESHTGWQGSPGLRWS